MKRCKLDSNVPNLTKKEKLKKNHLYSYLFVVEINISNLISYCSAPKFIQSIIREIHKLKISVCGVKYWRTRSGSRSRG